MNSPMANQSDNRRSRFVSLRIPHDLVREVEQRRVPGQSLAYLLVEAIRSGLARAPAPSNTHAHEQGTKPI